MNKKNELCSNEKTGHESVFFIGFRNVLIIAVTFTGNVIFIPGGSIVSKCDPCIIHVENRLFYCGQNVQVICGNLRDACLACNKRT
jgi:hypothetical protein